MATIDEMPTGERPTCRGCGGKLGYRADDVEAKSVDTGQTYAGGDPIFRRVVTRKRFRSWKGYPTGARVPLFCTLRCALSFAIAAVHAEEGAQP